jgi:hypothetical protein
MSRSPHGKIFVNQIGTPTMPKTPAYLMNHHSGTSMSSDMTMRPIGPNVISDLAHRERR